MGKKEKQTKEKPLDKMTAKELRELAMEIPDITGAHGMNKSELLAAIKKARGVEDDAAKKGPDTSVREIKARIRELKQLRTKSLAEKDKRMAGIYRRRISRLKKKARKAA